MENTSLYGKKSSSKCTKTNAFKGTRHHPTPMRIYGTLYLVQKVLCVLGLELIPVVILQRRTPESVTCKGSIVVGNGESLAVSHIGTGVIGDKSCPLPLNNVLVIPGIIMNLLSVARLTEDYPCYFIFYPFWLLYKGLEDPQGADDRAN
ncbi:hypothetical protein CRG98_039351 [Punica granatum]|uniref:Uncharacterized protein n=1 Tax=Punica granatum TaxID=22663 RepID=A0A2I0I8V7_PUNGR|nr:hypothetical protein CRG98_039351 [Punica granatum]